MSDAQSLYNQGVGAQPWTGPTTPGLSSQSQQALNQTESIANQGNPLGQQAYSGTLGLLQSGGMSDPQVQAQAPLWNIANNPQVNPGLQDMLKANDARITDNVNGEFSAAGRYGSDDHAQTLARNLGQSDNAAITQDYNQGVQNQMSAANSLNTNYGQGLSRSLYADQLTPSLYSQLYTPSQQLGQVGSAYDAQNSQQLQNAMNAWSASQNTPWQQLAQLNAIGTQQGQLGGTSNSSSATFNAQPTGVNKFLTGLTTGAGVGGAIGGPWGAGLGALGGGLLSL
jgi:hypothetical protein